MPRVLPRLTAAELNAHDVTFVWILRIAQGPLRITSSSGTRLGRIGCPCGNTILPREEANRKMAGLAEARPLRLVPTAKGGTVKLP